MLRIRIRHAECQPANQPANQSTNVTFRSLHCVSGRVFGITLVPAIEHRNTTDVVSAIPSFSFFAAIGTFLIKNSVTRVGCAWKSKVSTCRTNSCNHFAPTARPTARPPDRPPA